MGVLKYESIICQKIIEYKKQNKFEDEDVWENKKDNIDFKIQTMETKFQNEQISIPEYFNLIKKEFSYEKTALNKLKEIKTNDNKIYENQIQVQMNRINKRIELINAEIEELKQMVQAETEAQENNNESKVEEKTNETNNESKVEEKTKETNVIEKNEEKKNRICSSC